MEGSEAVPNREVVCLGVNVADLVAGPLHSFPDRGGMVVVDEMGLYPGGGAVNTAITLSRLGIPASVVGCIGQDHHGEFLLENLIGEGISVDRISQDPELNTSATMVMVDPDGERRFVHHVGANRRLTAGHVTDEILRGTAILHIAYAFVLPGLDGAPMAELLRRAKDLGVVTVLDTAWDSQERWMDLLGPCLPYIDYFIPNLVEAQALTQLSDPFGIAKELIKNGVKNVIIKMNVAGSLYMNKYYSGFISPAYKVEAVDSTGAGDSFDAGIIAGIWHKWSPKKSLQFANALGALCASGHGAVGRISSLNDTLEFMDSQPFYTSDQMSTLV